MSLSWCHKVFCLNRSQRSLTLIFYLGTMYINILPKIPTIGLKKEDVDSLITNTYEEMNTQYQKINKEIIEKVKDKSI